MVSNGFFAMSALTFVACVALTAVWSASMSAMGGMPMPGGAEMAGGGDAGSGAGAEPSADAGPRSAPAAA